VQQAAITNRYDRRRICHGLLPRGLSVETTGRIPRCSVIKVAFKRRPPTSVLWRLNKLEIPENQHIPNQRPEEID
jgi:hypothetical protein